MFKLRYLIALTFITAQGMAQENSASLPAATSTTTIAPVVKAQEPKKFSFDFSMESSSNTYETGALENYQDTGFLLMPGYQITPNQKLSVKAVIIQEHTGEKNTSLSNTEILLTLPKKEINEKTTLTSSVRAVIPTNKESIELDRLKGAAGASGRLSYKIKEHSVAYGLGLTKNVHDYNINGNGVANISYRLNQSVSTNIVLPQKFSLDASMLYSIARTYQDVDKYSFEFSADLNYQASEQMSLNLGTTNGGSALKANGSDSNIALYDTKSSVIRAGLSLSY